MNPNAIQKLLEHATLDMLSVYAHPSTEFLKEECKKYNFYYEKDRNDTNEKVIPIDFRKIVYDGENNQGARCYISATSCTVF